MTPKHRHAVPRKDGDAGVLTFASPIWLGQAREPRGPDRGCRAHIDGGAAASADAIFPYAQEQRTLYAYTPLVNFYGLRGEEAWKAGFNLNGFIRVANQLLTRRVTTGHSDDMMR